MGIRFLCPNGHKLNVKSELAGRRALCPECGAKLRVPSGYDSAADDVPAATASVELPVAMPSGMVPLESATGTPVAAPEVAAPAVTATMPSPPASVWYVRPKSGGQYGPATDEVFRMWIQEGRVAADAHVWRDGWADWKLARDAEDVLPVSLPSADAESGSQGAWPVYGAATESAEPPKVAAAAVAVLPAVGEEAIKPGSRYLADKKRANKRQLSLAIGMLVAIVVLAAILVWVLTREQPAVEPTTGSAWRPIRLVESWVAFYPAGAVDEFSPCTGKQRS